MEKIKTLLVEQGYPQHMIVNTIEKLLNLQPQTKEAFSVWIVTNNEPNITIEGFSYKSLVENYGMKPIGAFLTLDWLLREPDKAIHALKSGIK